MEREQKRRGKRTDLRGRLVEMEAQCPHCGTKKRLVARKKKALWTVCGARKVNQQEKTAS